MMTSTELIVVVCGLILTGLALVVTIQKFKALELLAQIEEDLANFYVPEVLQIQDTDEHTTTEETETNNDNVNATKEEDGYEPDSDDISMPVG